ncbi:MAG TPA: hypothetical protein VI750_03505 [Pyrinomonadaceae bacterium]|nr:hypothetical protein [Pyrinomonadaceae bacterium]
MRGRKRSNPLTHSPITGGAESISSYQRALDCLSCLTKDEPEPRRNHLITDVTAFMRVALALGVRDRERAEFWRHEKQRHLPPAKLCVRRHSGGDGLSLSHTNSGL